jgi:diguanylate cyclase (GGDEF)-like protein
MRERIEELERLVDSDTLTPLPNRRRFVREVERVVQHGRRYGTPASWVMFIDLDGLKQINDSHGHIAGDAALIHVADILRAMVRTTDVVARIGGDEYGLLLEQIDAEAAYDKAQRLIEAVAGQPMILAGKRVCLSISIGLAELSADDDAETLIARADSAMYARRAQVRSAR